MFSIAFLAPVALVSALIAPAGPAASEAPASTATPAAPASMAQWRQVLGALDDVRAMAYRESDARLLTTIYADGSPMSSKDLAVMVSYTARGLTVDMEMHIHAVTVLKRSPERVRLDVVDQLASARVHTAGGSWRSLPADRPTRRIITLMFDGGDWRISAVQPR